MEPEESEEGSACVYCTGNDATTEQLLDYALEKMNILLARIYVSPYDYKSLKKEYLEKHNERNGKT